MECITVREESANWLDAFDPASLPSALSQHIQLVYSGERVGLKIGGVIGAVRLLNGTTLRVTPKVGEFNFVRMLTRCEGLYDELRDTALEPAGYGISEELGGMRLVVRQFSARLTELKKRSLDFYRPRRRRILRYAAGRMDPVQTERRLLLNLQPSVVTEVRERSYDTPENRVLGAAAIAALPLLQADDEQEGDVLREWASTYGTRFAMEDLTLVNRRVAAQKHAGSRGYYGPALSLAKVLLWQAGIAADRSINISADATLIESSTLFERYVRKVLVDASSGESILVTKGAGMLEASLFVDGSFRLIPDFVFAKLGSVLCLGDAKYKTPDAGDHYQMACYLDRYNVRTGVLIVAGFDDNATVRSKRYDIADGRRIWVVQLPLCDLDATEAALADLLVNVSVFGSEWALRRAAS